ncbi:MAG TPA: hypothetical protein VD913_05600, partial [bacterium]|nr:hypothetical protein [bacterium]
MKTWKATRFSLSLVTLLTFTLTSLRAELPLLPVPSIWAEREIDATAPPDIPSHLGTVTSFKPGTGPTLIHIQTAHGNYEAQKNIQAILTYLQKQEGINLIFVEGSAFKLEPEILKFFPDQMDLTMKIADAMAKKALVKGVELFLLENSGAEAYGIEDMEAYRANREAFKEVLQKRQTSTAFL